MSPELKKEIFEWIKTIGAALAIAFVLNLFGGGALVEGESMSPTLGNKDFLIQEKLTYKSHEPQRGDIITFNTDLEFDAGIQKALGMHKILIKRVIGLPGDHIKVTGGEVFVNGYKLQEDYIKDGTTDGEIDVTVPEGSLFVMGDNRLNSNDSRRDGIGFIKKEKVIGRVVVRLFPFDQIGGMIHNGIPQLLKDK